eukprot:TRINITY_DN49938_c0_g1_i1.p1 TRINITY_DN49938_c0_g1~~TRINITY_DN49938_c0_g1_i1.p1  ORF type:complete len:360 (-),score=41.53 TRINITY_DN49938_c0_g1_i1:40-1062(-)
MGSICSRGPVPEEARGLNEQKIQEPETQPASPVTVQEPLVARGGFHKYLVVSTFFVWLAFMWFLPMWSHLFNDTLGMFNHQWQSNTTGPNNFLCMTPPEEMHCSDGRNFADLEVVQKRMQFSKRRNVGCGCSQGVIGEGSCPQDGELGFTLSSYISTPPAIAAFVGLLSPSVVSMWWAMAAVNKELQPNACMQNLQFFALLAFQISFALFAIGSDCIFLQLHLLMTRVFQATAWIYNLSFVIMACCAGPCKSNIILIVAISAGIAVGGSTIAQAWGYIFAPILGAAYTINHGFFIFECIMLTGCFSVGPMLLLFGHIDVQVSSNTQVVDDPSVALPVRSA